MTKNCSGCKEQLPTDAFGMLTGTKDGLNRRCKDCMNKANRATQAKDPDRFHNQRRTSWLKRNYNITPADYDKMEEDQGGKCGICGSDYKGTNRGYWCVDHCHTSGKVRGLLCGTCNKALGQLGDTKEALQRAIDYLNKD